MLKEFKAFIARGNVVDLAVGVIIGAAFTSIVTSLTKNLINPLIGLFIGKIDLSGLVFSVGNAHFRYGLFIDSVINFLIIAFVVFSMVKAINQFLPKTDKKDAAPSASEAYLKQIRDLLKEKESD